MDSTAKARSKPNPTISVWGAGAAPLVKPSTRRSTESVVFLSDIHAPFHDPAAVAAAVRLVKELQPDRVVINGDVADFFQLSRFNTGLERIDLLQQEIDIGNEIRRAIRRAAPDAELIENEGNHDSRIRTFVEKNARSLTSLRALDPASLFLYDELAITPYGAAGFRLRQDFLVKHGSVVRKGSGATAKAELLAAGISGISGHTHRLATYRANGYVPRQWTEQGCLCLTTPDYIVGVPDWQPGIVVGEFSTKSQSFVTHEVPLIDGKLRLGLSSF